MDIFGKFVKLCAIEKDDLIQLQAWNNNPEICYMIGGWHFPSSSSQMNNWYENIQKDQLNQRFAIHTSDCGLIGTANLVDINWKDKNAFHGMLIGDKDIRGKGFGIDTVMAVMRYAFEELGLNRLDGSIIEYNLISHNLYVERCGWKEEGRRREWYFRKNQFWNQIIVGVTKKDYINLIEDNPYWEL
jgi:RimJ/RimL family protein N-acetyltransferase